MKKIASLLILVMVGILSLVPFTTVSAKEKVNVYIFHRSTCPHCQAAIKYFESLEEEYGDKFNLVKYEVWGDTKNADLMQQVADVFGDEVTGVPYIVIGDKTFKGYSESSNESILTAITDEYESNDSYDVMDHLGSSTTVYITLGIIVIGLVCILGFSKAKAN